MTHVLRRYIQEDGQFKAMVAETTGAGREAFLRLKPSPIALQLLTQAMTGAVLMSANLKDEGTLMIGFEGDGPLGGLTAEANTLGHVRGAAGNPRLDFLPDPDLGLFQRAIGKGKLSVKRKSKPSDKVFTSIVPLVEGEMALNFAHYFLRSEQIPSALQIGVSLDPRLGVSGAGGLLIQALPGANEHLMFMLEDRIANLPSLGGLFAAPDCQDQVLQRLFEGLNMKLLAQTEVTFYCPCSKRRMLRILSALPTQELREMRHSKEPLRLNCSFCGQSYPCLAEDLDPLLVKSERRGE